MLLVLLDLSAAFDTVNHRLLIGQLALKLRISGVVLDWVISYLSDRTQFVSTSDSKSDTQKLLRDVPQGSVLGAILFTIYTQPLRDIVRRHNMKCHLYTNNT